MEYRNFCRRRNRRLLGQVWDGHCQGSSADSAALSEPGAAPLIRRAPRELRDRCGESGRADQLPLDDFRTSESFVSFVTGHAGYFVLHDLPHVWSHSQVG